MRFLNSGAVLLALLISGCGSGTIGGDDDGGPNSIDADPADICSRASNCPPGQVCDPSTDTCIDDLECTQHSDCGVGGVCGVSGVCEVNVTGGPCDTATDCAVNETCISGFCGCEGEAFTAEAVPPNVLIVLDKSGSMDNNIGNMTKFEIAQGAIATLLTNYGATVRFGLSLYPSNSGCGNGLIDVPIDVGTEVAINTAINVVATAGPNGSTPIGDSLDSYRSYVGLQDAGRQNFILLITDGEETCGGDGETAAGALFAQAPPVRTFVVGFGSGVDPDSLNAMAVAGDTALANGPPFYYQADNAADLNMALDDIGGAVLSCTYTLSGTPNDPDDVYVHFDGTTVPRDASHAGGWDYDPLTGLITFYGTSCDSLRAGAIMDLVIVNACVIDVP